MPARNPKLAFREEDEKPVPTPAPINAGDAVARDLFGGAAFQPNALPRLGRTIGRAVAGAIDATKDAFTPLIPTQYGDSMAAAPVPNVPAFPSGAIGGGFDIYPSSPQMAPSKPQPFPYGHALGPSVYRQDPTQTTLTTGLVGGVGTAKDFSSFNPQPYAGYIPFGDSGTTMMSLGFGGGGQRTFYPSTTDITGRSASTGQNVTALTGTTTPFVGAENPMLAANPQGFTPFTPRSERVAPLPSGLPLASSMPIEGGPMSFSGATAMGAPKTAEQRGLTPIQTPRGTIYASAEQEKNLASRSTAYEGRTPEQQQALLAQMRQKGATLSRQSVDRQEEFFKQKRAEIAALAQATGEAYKDGMSPQSVRQARSAYTSQQPTSIAGIQRQFAAMAPAFDRPMAERTAFVREPFGIPSGGPQPATGFANSFPFIEDRNRNPFSSIYGFGA